MLKIRDLREIRRRVHKSQNLLAEDFQNLFRDLKQACENLEKDESERILTELLRCSEEKRNLSLCLKVLDHEATDKKRIYVVGSLFLRECSHLLSQERSKKDKESLYYITGVELEETLILDRVFAPQLSKQSGFYVLADQTSSQKILSELDNYGHGLYAWFHNHTAEGEAATKPSPTDMKTQERLERGGYKAIGGIFSEDGFLRFFSTTNDFKILVFGKGVKKINEFLFKIEEIQKV